MLADVLPNDLEMYRADFFWLLTVEAQFDPSPQHLRAICTGMCRSLELSIEQEEETKAEANAGVDNRSHAGIVLNENGVGVGPSVTPDGPAAAAVAGVQPQPCGAVTAVSS